MSDHYTPYDDSDSAAQHQDQLEKEEVLCLKLKDLRELALTDGPEGMEFDVDFIAAALGLSNYRK